MSATATVTDVLGGTARWCVVEGDSAAVTRSLPDARFDALVTDPPSGIAFMGAEWDRDKGGRLQWAAWLAGILADARRATRDGGRSLVWALPRTTHWTGCAVEDAGWAIETVVTHLFGTGWPKGASQLKPSSEHWYLARTGPSTGLNVDGCRVTYDRDSPNPASNPLYRKMSGYANGNAPHKSGTLWGLEGKGERNPQPGGRWPPNTVFTHSPGCERVRERRVQGNSPFGPCRTVTGGGIASGIRGGARAPAPHADHADPDGTELVDAWRCVEGCPVAELDRQSGERKAGWFSAKARRGMGYSGSDRGVSPRTVGAHALADTGTASRYFPQFPADDPDAPWSEALFRYVAKPSRAERNAGCDGMPEQLSNATGFDGASVAHRIGSDGKVTPKAIRGPAANHHPTVKSVALMRWLIRLVTKPGDVVLDPFGGSGTTGVAALLEGRRVILVEREPAFAAIARARCAAADGSEWAAPIVARPREVKPADARQPGLFDGRPL